MGISPTIELVAALIQPNLSTVHRYLPGLLMVIRNEADRRSADARAEYEENG